MSAGQDEAPQLFESLPTIVVQQHILSHASSQTLCRVAACSKLLYSIATAAVLWQPLCEARAWGPFKQGQSWHQGFCIEYSKLCVECRRPTRYIFKLFGCRLCEKCEFEHHKYGLVTSREAAERYGLTAPQLARLECVPFHSTLLHLRSEVIKMAESVSSGGAHMPRGSLGATSAPGASTSGSTPAGSGCGSGEEQGAGDEGAPGGSSEEDKAREGQEDGDANAAVRRAAEKAARKAHKKQVKEEQRQKRQAKKLPAGQQSLLLGSSPPARPTPSPPPSSSGSRHVSSAGSTPCPPPSSSGNRHASSSGSTSPAARSFLAAGSFMTGSSPTGGSFVPGSSPPGGRRGRDRRARSARTSKVWTEDGTHMMPGKKAVSGWLAERQQLMEEWGEYAMSGLVLAP